MCSLMVPVLSGPAVLIFLVWAFFTLYLFRYRHLGWNPVKSFSNRKVWLYLGYYQSKIAVVIN